MQMNQPAPPNPLDANRHGLIGLDLDRVDGPQKVCGTAPYAYEVQEAPERPLYGYIVEAPIGCGRVVSLSTGEAERAPGVVHVMTHLNAPEQASFSLEESERFNRPHPILGDPVIPHYGQPVAFVVAETFEQARAASLLVQAQYEVMPGQFLMKEHLDLAEKPPEDEGKQPDSQEGDFDTAFAASAVQLDVEYTTPVHIHAQMEPMRPSRGGRATAWSSTARRRCWRARRSAWPTRCAFPWRTCASSAATSAAASAASCRCGPT